MSTLGQKIRILRKNREWTQTDLANRVQISETAVQKWETDVNTPPLDELRRLCDVLTVTMNELTDDTLDFPEYYKIDKVSGECFRPSGDSDHVVYDAALRSGGTLHRFVNRGGVPYSAIFQGNFETFSCEREDEGGMIRCWNDGS